MTPLSVIAKNALYEALSFGLPGRSSFSGLGQSDTGGDPLMNRIVSGGKRPLGGIEVPSGLDAGGGFGDTLSRMGYKSTVDPETGKEQLLAPRKETGKKLEQSPISFSGGRGTGVRRPERMPSRQYGEVRTTPGYMGQNPVTTRTVEQERMDKEIVDRSAEQVFKKEFGTSAPRGPGGEIMNPNTNSVSGSGALARSRQVDPERQRLAAERRQKDLQRARSMGMTP